MSKVLKRIWMLLAVLIIFMAVTSSIFRSLTPWAKKYTGEVEQRLSFLIGQPVTIQTMETSWYWFQPVLKLNQVTLSDDANQTIRVTKLLVGINLFKSLWNRQIQPGILYIDDVRVNVREKEAHWTIDGLNTSALNPGEVSVEKTKKILAWLSQQEHLIMKQVSMYFYLSDGDLIPVTIPHLSIANNRGYYKIKGEARLVQTNSTDFQLLGEGYFDLERFKNVEGEFYFLAKNIIPEQWQALFSKRSVHLEGGNGDVALWVSVHHGSISSAQAQVQLKQLNLHSLHQQTLLLQTFFANLLWKPDDLGWQLHADNMQLRVGNVSWPENQLLLHYNKERQTYQLFVKSIIIESLLSKAIDWPKNIQYLLDMEPHGVLHDTQVVFTLNASSIPPIPVFSSQNSNADDSKPIHYILTQFEHLGWHAKNQGVHVKNLAGVLNWQSEQGRLELDSENTSLKIKEYPTQTFTSLHGVCDWKELNDGLRLSVDRFVLSGPELTISLQAALDQVTLQSVGHIRLGAEFSGKNWQQWTPLLPKNNLKPKLYHWLRYDLKRIANASGRITFNGMAKDFPFDNNTGEFILESYASGGELAINSKWPVIREIYGTIYVKNRNLDVNIDHANFMGAKTKYMHLRIDDIGKNKENLIVNGTMNDSAQKMIHYVMASPLKKKLTLLDMLSIKGPAVLNLNVEAPLYPENDKVLVQGSVNFKNNTLQVHHELGQLALEDLTGDLLFHETGMSKSNLNAHLMGQPMTIQIQSVQSATTITMDGICTVDSLKNQFKLPMLNLVDGSFPVTALLKFMDKSAAADSITINSSLQGMTINLPSPLGKKSDTLTPVQLNLKLNSKKVPGTHDTRLSMDLLFRNPLNALKVKAKLLPDENWSFNLKQNNTSANLVYHPPTHELSGHAQHVHLDQIDTSDEVFATSMPQHPNQIPNLNLRIDDLSIGSVYVGDLSLSSKSTDTKWSLDYCQIDSPVYQFNVSGEWMQKKNVNRTKLDVKLNISDLGKTLELWDVTPAVLAKKGYMEFHGGWKDSIYKFSLASLNGALFLQLKNGRITHLNKETEEKLGLGKLLSILSLQTIPRRLQLDFSDLAQGYSFDNFQGNFAVNEGIMQTQDSFLEGPVAYANMKGSLNLVKHSYDLHLQISPHVTASLPIVATIAGGPIAGVATWVASNIINQSMQKISAYSYKISGPWNNPVVQQVSICTLGKKGCRKTQPKIGN